MPRIVRRMALLTLLAVLVGLPAVSAAQAEGPAVRQVILVEVQPGQLGAYLQRNAQALAIRRRLGVPASRIFQAAFAGPNTGTISIVIDHPSLAALPPITRSGRPIRSGRAGSRSSVRPGSVDSFRTACLSTSYAKAPSTSSGEQGTFCVASDDSKPRPSPTSLVRWPTACSEPETTRGPHQRPPLSRPSSSPGPSSYLAASSPSHARLLAWPACQTRQSRGCPRCSSGHLTDTHRCMPHTDSPRVRSKRSPGFSPAPRPRRRRPDPQTLDSCASA